MTPKAPAAEGAEKIKQKIKNFKDGFHLLSPVNNFR